MACTRLAGLEPVSQDGLDTPGRGCAGLMGKMVGPLLGEARVEDGTECYCPNNGEDKRPRWVV